MKRRNNSQSWVQILAQPKVEGDGMKPFEWGKTKQKKKWKESSSRHFIDQNEQFISLCFYSKYRSNFRFQRFPIIESIFAEWGKGSISPTFYMQLLCIQIPKLKKRYWWLHCLIALFGSVRVKASRKYVGEINWRKQVLALKEASVAYDDNHLKRTFQMKFLSMTFRSWYI